jgi:hypothetical protein
VTFIVRRTASRNHYYVDIDVAPRHRVPGVTTIGKAMANKKLENYAASATADYAVNHWDELSAMPPADRLRAIMGGRWNQRDDAGNIGTTIHRLGEKLVVGEPVAVPKELEGYVKSYVGFLDQSDLNAHHIEVPCYSAEHQYAGTIDLIGDLVLPDVEEWEDVPRDSEGRSTGVLDPKTGKGVYESAAFQLVAYRNAEKLILAGATIADPLKRQEADMPSVDFTAAVHVHPDGRPATLIRTDSSPEAFRSFLYLRQVYDLQQDAELLIYPPTPYPAQLPVEPADDDAQLGSVPDGEFSV